MVESSHNKQHFLNDDSLLFQRVTPLNNKYNKQADIIHQQSSSSSSSSSSRRDPENVVDQRAPMRTVNLHGYRLPERIWLACVVAIMTCCPLMVFYFWFSLDRYNGALSGPIMDLFNQFITTITTTTTGRESEDDRVNPHLLPEIYYMIPRVSSRSIQLYAFWFLFQALLMATLPSKTWYGKVTFTGNVMEYRCINGLYAWIVTHVAFIVGSMWFQWFKPTIIYDYWGEFLFIAQSMGFIFTFLFYLKGRFWPTCSDARVTGNFIYDLYWGVELNPRLTPGTKNNGWFDIKLFMNGRPGIVAWTLINLSFACKQYELYGYVTNSMILLNLLHAVYVLDFFYHEAWYIGTIDIIHDRMGFYLAWGDLVWLPYMYTLQSFYLVKNPIHLSNAYLLFVTCLGLTGYFIFRSVNNQKDYFRSTDGQGLIWGRKPEFITAQYTSGDGVKHSTKILCSGFWGWSRHFNYFGDLCMCLAFGMTCGFNHLLPYFYFFYMTVLLVQRGYRDDERCSLKYGKAWEIYRNRVPYRIVPYVF